tara:strand:- start:1223 stop:4048 length:2826 start_codon:yes stop_codon:yes gene_type:complete
VELTIDQALQQGIASHKEGKLQDAERLYRAILQSQPNHPDANHNLGVLAVAVGKTLEALPLFKKALGSNPAVPQFWLSYIDALIKIDQVNVARQVLADAQQAGVAVEELRVFERRLEGELFATSRMSQQEINYPTESAQGELLTAIDLREAGKYKKAIDWLRQFVQHNPAHPEALSLLSHVLLLDKREAEAEKILKAAASINSTLPSVYRNQARLLLKQSKPAEALERAQRGHKQSPEDCESSLVLATCLGANQQDLKALSLIEEILRAKPNYAEGYATRALIKVRSENVVEAIKDAEAAVSLKPHLTQMWQLLGHMYHQRGDLTRAIEAVRGGYNNDPENVALMVTLGELLRQDNTPSEAIDILTRAIELAPENSNAWANLGIAFQQEKRLYDARIAYERALALNPKSAAIASNLGTIAKEAEEWESAVKYFQRALEIEPGLAEAHNNLGTTLRVLGRSDEAEASLKMATALKPDYAEAQYNLGNTLRELGRLDEAEASLRKAIALRPNYAKAQYNLGVTLKDLNRLEDAEATLKKAIAIRPEYTKAHNSLGVTLRELRKLDRSEQSLVQATALSPDFAEAHSNLGITLQALGRLDDAEASLRKAIAVKPDWAEVHYNLGNILKVQGRVDEAATSFTEAIALRHDFAEAHSNLGSTLQELGRLDEAEASLRHAIELNPDSPAAYFNLHGTQHDIQSAEHWIDKCLQADGSQVEARLIKAALRFYQGDRKHFDELMQSELRSHPYARSFSWVFKLPSLPELHFDKRKFFDAVLKKSITSRPFYEFGVWRASSFKYLIEVFKKGYGFDTFTGLPEDWNVGSHVEAKGKYTNDGRVPKIKGGQFIVGEFKDTLPVFFSESRPKASLINFDADLYSSTICALNFSKSVMDKDTILVFDELIMNESWEQDEFKALEEFCSNNQFSFEVLAVSFSTKQVALKLIGI